MTWVLDISMSDGKIRTLPFDSECDAREAMSRIRRSVSSYTTSMGDIGCSSALFLRDYGMPDVILFVSHITALEVREVSA